MENKQTKKEGDINNDKLVEQKHKKGEEQLKFRGGNDGNKTKGGHKEGIITRWDPKPKLDQVNTSNQFQALEEQQIETSTAERDTQGRQQENNNQQEK